MEDTQFTNHVERPVRTPAIKEVEALIISAQNKLLEARELSSKAELIFTEAACNRALDLVRHGLALLSKGA